MAPPYKLSDRSAAQLETCTYNLQRIIHTYLQYRDLTVICGHRNETDQSKAYAEKRSTKQWPTSKHNLMPSPAIDTGPYYPESKIDWRTDAELLKAAQNGDWDAFRAILENIKRWVSHTSFLRGIAAGKEISVRTGDDWNRDFRFNDHTLIDMPHLEEV